MGVESQGRLAFFPVAFFSMVMGLSGVSIAWLKFMHVSGQTVPLLAPFFAGLVSVVFLGCLLFYGGKLMRFPRAVLAELSHPIKINFFPTISISLLLLSIVYLEVHEGLSLYLWYVGAAAHFAFTLYVVDVWMHHERHAIQHMNPAWLIPAVGNVLVPIAGVHHGFIGLSWFFFSVGMMFWVILMTVIMYRVLFHAPIDGRILPTLFILIAPPAVGFISYVKLTGGVDHLAVFLFNAGLFLTILLLSQAVRFMRLPFFLSWWAYSFPLAAISIASFLMYSQTGAGFYYGLGTALLGLLSVLVVFISTRTGLAIVRGEICQEGH